MELGTFQDSKLPSRVPDGSPHYSCLTSAAIPEASMSKNFDEEVFQRELPGGYPYAKKTLGLYGKKNGNPTGKGLEAP